ncbi:MAG: ferredoxin--NADP reductase [Polyangiaceae bacterium]|nr:ferredoxin--NADP reductase [Polyangiaceae bacterium]
MGRVVGRRDWADGLFSLSVAAALEPHRPGQFVNLGLELDGELVRRAYSLASPPGSVAEVLVTVVPGGRLTPALARLRVGDELFVEPRAQGFFTLDYVPPAAELWLLATGTGLAPFVAMLRSGEPFRRFERVVLVHGVRERAHLAYADELAALARSHAGQLRRVACVTREAVAEGLEGAADADGLAWLRGRVPAALGDGRLEGAAGAALEPARVHVLMCGNPAMVDATTAVLEARGLRRHRQRAPGHFAAERFW